MNNKSKQNNTANKKDTKVVPEEKEIEKLEYRKIAIPHPDYIGEVSKSKDKKGKNVEEKQKLSEETENELKTVFDMFAENEEANPYNIKNGLRLVSNINRNNNNIFIIFYFRFS
jgi:hypothetical protein